MRLCRLRSYRTLFHQNFRTEIARLNAGMLLDQQLEKEMNSAYQNSYLPSFVQWLTQVSHIIDAISHLPTADDDKYAMNKNQLSSKVC